MTNNGRTTVRVIVRVLIVAASTSACAGSRRSSRAEQPPTPTPLPVTPTGEPASSDAGPAPSASATTPASMPSPSASASAESPEASLQVSPALPAQVPPSEPGACLRYGSDTVVLHGVIERATSPGQPNYESIAKGDAREAYWVLRVDPPFCVEQSFDLSGNVLEAAHSRVRRVQLVFSDGELYRTYHNLLGHVVQATGELFGAHTGHHHTEVLLNVTVLAPGQRASLSGSPK